MTNKSFTEVLGTWIGEMEARAKEWRDGAPVLGLFETEELFRVGKAWLMEQQAATLPDRFGDLDPDVPGYEPLRRVTDLAYNQSARGKGKERHNKAGKPFLQQPIMEIGRMVGVGYQSGQIMKKVQEATTMHQSGNHVGAKAELLGAIVYSAAAYMLVAELEAKETEG